MHFYINVVTYKKAFNKLTNIFLYPLLKIIVLLERGNEFTKMIIEPSKISKHLRNTGETKESEKDMT